MFKQNFNPRYLLEKNEIRKNLFNFEFYAEPLFFESGKF